MTDRHAAYIVVLDENLREDDAENVITALGMVKGVATVEPVVASRDQHIAKARMKEDVVGKLYVVIRDILAED